MASPTGQGRGYHTLSPLSHHPCLQAFSAFGELTIKSLADIEEEVSVGGEVPPLILLP